jgi:dihydroorotate dehydrogenase electron transfer subunit
LGNGFTPPKTGSKSLLVAGGIGIPPLLALSRQIEEMGRGSELTLVYGDSTHERMIDLDHPLIPGIELVLYTEDGSFGSRGLVTDFITQRIEPGVTDLYVCGPNAMMKAVHGLTPGLHAVSQYSLEARMACGYGVCAGCAVSVGQDEDKNYVRVCADGPVLMGDLLTEASFPVSI